MTLKKNLFYILKIYLIFITIASCTYKSSGYYEQVFANIIQNTSNGSMDIKGRKSIIKNEISRLNYENKLRILNELSIFDPKILKGIKSEIRQEIDKEYKESLLK